MANVPKFASFRPKPSQHDNSERPVVPTGRSAKPHRVANESSSKPERKSHTTNSHPKPLKDVQIDNDHLPFCLDLKGDANNLVYGGISKWQVPSFHRIGSQRVLGAGSRLRIKQQVEDQSIILQHTSNQAHAAHGKYVFSSVKENSTHLLKLRQDVHGDFDSRSAFVRLNENESLDASDGSDADSDDAKTTNYRSIHGRAKSDRPADRAFEFASDREAAQHDIRDDESSLRAQARLAQLVEADPRHLAGWLDLIDSHDRLLEAKSKQARPTLAEISSAAEIKIHLYEKALKNINDSEERSRLQLGLLKEGLKIWTPKQLSDAWNRAFKESPADFNLWRHYMESQQTTFTTFNFEQCKTTYLERLAFLSGALRDSKAGADPEHRFKVLGEFLHTILGYTLLSKRAGYSELASATWQAVLEFTFRAPLAANEHNSTTSFQLFWESEVPRIGEAGAHGWAAYHESAEAQTAVKARVDEKSRPTSRHDLFKTWAQAERHRTDVSQTAARTTDDVVENDPFRVILFSDIEPVITCLPPDIITQQRLVFEAFLAFCGLPAISVSSFDNLDTTRVQHNDTSILDEALGRELSLRRSKADSIELHASTRPIFQGYITDHAALLDLRPSTSMLFSPLYPTTLLQCPAIDTSSHEVVAPSKRVHAILETLAEASNDEAIAAYCLVFEWHNRPQSIKHVAKRLMRRFPNSIELYNIYAMITARKVDLDVADKIWEAAIQMGKGPASIILWQSWAWAHLEAGNKQRALMILCSTLQDKLSTDLDGMMAIARGRAMLEENITFELNGGKHTRGLLYAECLMLLHYLTEGDNNPSTNAAQGNIDAALDSASKYIRQSERMAPHASQSRRRFLHSATRLLHCWMTAAPYRPAMVRDTLENWLATFPNDTLLLGMYSWNEYYLRMDNRVRTLLSTRTLVSKHDSLAAQAFAISFEEVHGNKHSTRQAFESATASSACKGSAEIWKWYMLFCARTPEYRGILKEVWLRAIRACPWSKDLFITGFEIVSLDSEESMRIWRVMGEKDLRVHIDIEEELESE